MRKSDLSYVMARADVSLSAMQNEGVSDDAIEGLCCAWMMVA